MEAPLESTVGEAVEQPLAPLYYRDNFLRLCETVQGQYGDLLSADESAFLARFHALSIDAQCLYIRLVSRTGPLFRVSKLVYDEIPDLAAAQAELQSAELLLEVYELPLEALFNLFTRPELEMMFAAPLASQPRPSSKAALLEVLRREELTSDALLAYRQRVDSQPVVMPAGTEHVALLQVLFFGNRYQSLTQFVLEDLGVTRFYPYALHPENRLFSCRDALEEYLTCAEFADARYEALETESPEQLIALATVMPQYAIAYESSRPRWDKLCNRLGRDLERLDEPEQALAVYSLSGSHPSRERRARIFERTGALPEARALCEQILQNPLNEAENDAAGIILPRVRRKLEGVRTPRSRDQFDTLDLVIPCGEGNVESQAADYLATGWNDVRYVENRLMNALFGLAFWDVIFADEPGVFHHPFQGGPADMYEAGFRQRRDASIRARQAQLASAPLAEELVTAFHRFHGYSNHWVDWRSIDVELVERAGHIIPAAHLLAIWERMLFDPRENRRGFPDLVAFGENAGQYAMIEVKGPGDALQDNQKRWLRFFQANAIPAQVAWVTWQDNGDSVSEGTAEGSGCD